MGGLMVYYHSPRGPSTVRSGSLCQVFKAFAFLGNFLRNPLAIKISSDILTDTAKLADLLDLPQNCPHVFDTLLIVERLQD